MTFTIDPIVIECLKTVGYFCIGWAFGTFVRWFNKETNN